MPDLLDELRAAVKARYEIQREIGQGDRTMIDLERLTAALADRYAIGRQIRIAVDPSGYLSVGGNPRHTPH